MTVRPDDLTPGLAELDDAIGERDLARGQLMEAERLLAAVPELEAALEDAIARVKRMSAERDGIVAESVRARAERERAQADIERLAAETAALRAECERMLAVMAQVWRSPSWRLTAPLRAVKGIFRRPSSP